MSYIASIESKQREAAVAELIYTGSVLARQNILITHSGRECQCGPLRGDPTNPLCHAVACPVSRFYAVIIAVERQVRRSNNG